MKLKIAIQKSFAMTCIRCLAHSVDSKLQGGKLGLARRRQAGCQSFKRATKLVKLHYVLMAEMDDPGASSGLLGDKPLLSQDVDCFSDRGLGDTEFGRPSTLNNPLTRPELPFHDFRAQQIGKGLFQKSFGRMAGLYWHLSARMGTFSHHIPRPLWQLACKCRGNLRIFYGRRELLRLTKSSADH